MAVLVTVSPHVACYRWQSAPPTAPMTDGLAEHTIVRVTPRFGRQTLLRRVGVAGDTLRGELVYDVWDRPNPPGAPVDRVSWALDQIKEVEIRRTDTPRTIAAATAGLGVGALIVVAIVAGSGLAGLGNRP